MSEKIITGILPEKIPMIFGNLDYNLSEIENRFDVTVSVINDGIKIASKNIITESAENNVSTAEAVILKLSEALDIGYEIDSQFFEYIMLSAEERDHSEIPKNSDCVCVTFSGKPIRPKTAGQKDYSESIRNNIITFGIGPAGTGKTYLAVANAVRAFKAREVSRILLTRPAVEAGEKLGFLPGDLQNKIDPYLRPLFDALNECFGSETLLRHMEKNTVEVAPLAYMRGRTLENSFVILDEAQNTTREQMKMFLTRLGNNSKMVITGDMTQTDLPDVKRSGLFEAERILKNIDGIEIHRLTAKDSVRHRLVRQIIKAYEKAES